MSDELKACPFCGGAATNAHWGLIHCSNEDCASGAVVSASSWNHRPIEDDLRAKLAVAVEALEEIRDNQYLSEVVSETLREALTKIR